jgi:hypothetical protein
VTERFIHLGFELFAAISWAVSTGILIHENIHIHNLKKVYDFEQANNLPFTGTLVTHQFNAVGRGGVITSIVLNAVTGVIL